MTDLLVPMFPPPLPNEPPLAFTTAEVRRLITPEEQQRWIEAVLQRREEEARRQAPQPQEDE